MGKSRRGRVVAIVVACAIVYLGLCVWAVRHFGRHTPRQSGIAQTISGAPSVDVVGKSVRPFDVTTADGGTLRIPDGKRSVALWLGDASQAAQAAGGFKQLAALLPQVQFVVAASGEGAPPPGSAPSLAFVTADAAKVSKTLGEMLGNHPRQSAEWWLIDANGRVQVFGEPGPVSPIMEADLAWPFLRDEAATPRDFKPTPVAKLCPDGANLHWRDRRLELWRHRLVDAYHQWGHHSAAWDDAAAAFLEQRCREWARHDSAADPATVAEMADKVMATGCDDPVVVFECAGALDDDREYNRSLKVFLRAAKLADRGHYPARNLYPLGFQAHRGKSEAAEEARRPAYKLFGESLAEPFAPGEQQLDVRLMLFGYMYNTGATGYPEAALAALSQPGADLWVRAWKDGEAIVERGWASRGTAWAGQTSQGQFASLEAYLDVAPKPLVLAWKLHPDFDEPAACMVDVCQGRDDRAGERFWTERALAADIDSSVSHEFNTLWPRWGGSHEEMRAFAAEMADHALLGTDAPLAMWRVQGSIAEDEMSPAVVQERAPLEAALATLDKMMAATSSAHRQARLKTYRAAVLAAAGRDQEAADTVAQLGDQIDLSVLSFRDHDTATYFVKWLRARDFSLAAQAEVTQLFQAHDYAAIRARYLALRDKVTLRAVRRWVDDALEGVADAEANQKAAAAPGK
jgi:hypothetical protein